MDYCLRMADAAGDHPRALAGMTVPAEFAGRDAAARTGWMSPAPAGYASTWARKRASFAWLGCDARSQLASYGLTLCRITPTGRRYTIAMRVIVVRIWWQSASTSASERSQRQNSAFVLRAELPICATTASSCQRPLVRPCRTRCSDRRKNCTTLGAPIA